MGSQAENGRCYERPEESFAPFRHARAGPRVKPRDHINRDYAQAADNSCAEQVVEIRGMCTRSGNVATAFVSLIGARLCRSIAKEEVLAVENANRLFINRLARPRRSRVLQLFP